MSDWEQTLLSRFGPEMVNDLSIFLLAELEQAERELRKVSSEADGWSIRAAYAEARLAKVPALVEALRGMVEPDPHTDGYANLEAAHAALADWDEKR